MCEPAPESSPRRSRSCCQASIAMCPEKSQAAGCSLPPSTGSPTETAGSRDQRTAPTPRSPPRRRAASPRSVTTQSVGNPLADLVVYVLDLAEEGSPSLGMTCTASQNARCPPGRSSDAAFGYFITAGSIQCQAVAANTSPKPRRPAAANVSKLALTHVHPLEPGQVPSSRLGGRGRPRVPRR